MKTNLIIVAFVALLSVFAIIVASEDISGNDNVNQQQLDLQRAAITQQEAETISKFTPETTTISAQAVTAVTATPSATMAPVQVVINIRGNEFQPEVITIQKGTTVIWQNLDIATHHVQGRITSNTVTHTALLESSPMRQGDRYFYTFAQPGIYAYSSTGDGFNGQITVVN
jgi:plastocyanin